MADGYRAARALLERADPVTAILTRTDVLAVGAMQAVHDLGLRVPEDVSVIGHDDIEVASMMIPPSRR